MKPGRSSLVSRAITARLQVSTTCAAGRRTGFVRRRLEAGSDAMKGQIPTSHRRFGQVFCLDEILGSTKKDFAGRCSDRSARNAGTESEKSQPWKDGNGETRSVDTLYW